MALRLLVIRHGETEWSRARRFAGSHDIPLTERGRRQCEAVAEALAQTPLAAVYTSPLERARTSAEIIAKPHRLEISIDPAWTEMAFGAWQGLTRAELDARFPVEAEAWRLTPHLAAPPGGEPVSAVAARVGAAVDALRAAHPDATVALVAHAIVIRLVVLGALGLGPERLWSVDASPAGITEIEYASGEIGRPAWTTVHRMNTVSHLESAGIEPTPATAEPPR
jgi:broad specificity phosphatase PhoE